jgi:hypothetical protein
MFIGGEEMIKIKSEKKLFKQGNGMAIFVPVKVIEYWNNNIDGDLKTLDLILNTDGTMILKPINYKK